ncbi:hypothetical protein DL96DRAFT_1502552, partial [Flagelloscypha sp. PMI_526]
MGRLRCWKHSRLVPEIGPFEVSPVFASVRFFGFYIGFSVVLAFSIQNRYDLLMYVIGKPSTPSQTPISMFFYGYNYPYDHNEETMAQFWRMCDQRGWGKFDSAKTDALDKLRDAMAIQFNHYYGTDQDSREVWVRFFAQLGVEEVPAKVKECKALSQTIHVNICDLVDNSIRRKDLQIFETSDELAAYSRSSGKIFPLTQAYAGGLLKFLLREI